MSALTDEDWEQLSAYHDGELQPDAERALRARIAREPALATALESLSDVSASLAVMRPASPASINGSTETRPKAANSNRKPMKWVVGGAVAASLLVAIVFGAGQFRSDSPLDVHASLSAQAFSYDQSAFVPAASSGSTDVPDLGGANLAPAVLRDFEDGTVAHYVGRNGCRLSYFRGAGPILMPSATWGQSTAWTTTDGLHHAIIATGMDAGKFDAIAAYLLTVTRRDAATEVHAALTIATETAAPCVG
ncbi:MAG: hypothetical protein AAF292_17250 [Pseudomonadota bacterium]